jgi:phosphoglycolate phosphatase
MQQAVQDLGWEPLADDAVRNIIGLGLPEALEQLFPNTGESERERVRQRYAENFVTADQLKPSEFFPSVMETLTHLRDQGHTLTIATGKSRKGLDRILAALKLETFFHATRCADETASKPHPLMLEQLLEVFAVPAEEAVMIGDTEYDMDMARQALMPRIAVSYGAHHVDRLRPYEPELCMDRFDELLGWKRL